jgi:hypothetical protein
MTATGVLIVEALFGSLGTNTVGTPAVATASTGGNASISRRAVRKCSINS